MVFNGSGLRQSGNEVVVIYVSLSSASQESNKKILKHMHILKFEWCNIPIVWLEVVTGFYTAKNVIGLLQVVNLPNYCNKVVNLIKLQ